MNAINLEQWLLAHAWVMVDRNRPVLKKTMLVEGNMYELAFSINAVMYSEKASAIMGERH